MNVTGMPFDPPPLAVNALTLRDYFAAQALMGWFAGFEAGEPYRDVDTEANARLAYRQADAMLAERAK